MTVWRALRLPGSGPRSRARRRPACAYAACGGVQHSGATLPLWRYCYRPPLPASRSFPIRGE